MDEVTISSQGNFGRQITSVFQMLVGIELAKFNQLSIPEAYDLPNCTVSNNFEEEQVVSQLWVYD